MLTCFSVCACSDGILGGDTGSPLSVTLDVGMTTKQEGNGDRAAYVFVFEDDRYGRLDTWQRVSAGGLVTLAATGGPKKVAAVSGAALDEDNWYWIESWDNMMARKISLAEESSDNMVRSGKCSMSGDVDKKGSIYMKPCCAKVRLRTLCVDFLGRPYENSTLENPRVYLINVNGEAAIFDEGPVVPGCYLNFSRLERNDLESMKDPSLIYKELPSDLGVLPQEVRADFYCYPNSIAEESLGRSFTRLVIEGMVDGRTYYWPINITGIERDRCYSFDVAITRTGSDDPDVPVTFGEVRVNSTVEDWEKTDDKIERF
ncbi:MAG: hypothetical protein MJY56_02190 [Bacteroidales bacterium]|nr:hypothetical protein [Bacteroidales bacterium]